MHHLYGTLAYCILWPTEMQELLSVAAILAFDPVEDFKMPCMLVDGSWGYYTKLQLLIFMPMVIAVSLSAATMAVHTVRAHYKHKHETRKSIDRWLEKQRDEGDVEQGDMAVKESEAIAAASYKLKMRSSVKHAVETCVSLVCMILDFAYPVCSRTILDIFQCRQLGDAGFFLEADYSIKHVFTLNAPHFIQL